MKYFYEMEIWKDIKDYEGFYQVSNFGKVRNSKGLVIKFGLNKSGYHFVVLSKNSKLKRINVATLVATHFLDHVQCGHLITINHISGNKTDNSVNNLEFVTSRKNKILSIDKSKTTSKYTGVHFSKQRNKWVSQITINGIPQSLGRFKTETEAHEAYQNKLKNI